VVVVVEVVVVVVVVVVVEVLRVCASYKHFFLHQSLFRKCSLPQESPFPRVNSPFPPAVCH